MGGEIGTSDRFAFTTKSDPDLTIGVKVSIAFTEYIGPVVLQLSGEIGIIRYLAFNYAIDPDLAIGKRGDLSRPERGLGAHSGAFSAWSQFSLSQINCRPARLELRSTR